MSKTSKPCCPMCTPAGLEHDPYQDIREKVAKHGWAVPSIFTSNPYHIGFSYTVGLAAEPGRPELIAFGNDANVIGHLLNTVAEKTASRRRWDKRFQMSVAPGSRVQLRPVLDVWRDRHALLAIDYWDGPAFPLWQVRRPRGDGTFSWDGTCCTPPCQPLLDLEEPWLPVQHDLRPPATQVLWHRVVPEIGPWQGRWETFGARPLDDGTFVICDVPFLADDLALLDVVSVRRESSGRDVIQAVVERSEYATLRIDGRHSGGPDAGCRGRRGDIEAVLDTLNLDADVVFACNHWSLPHWTVAVPVASLAWAEEVLRPLRREGLVEYEIARG